MLGSFSQTFTIVIANAEGFLELLVYFLTIDDGILVYAAKKIQVTYSLS